LAHHASIGGGPSPSALERILPVYGCGALETGR